MMYPEASDAHTEMEEKTVQSSIPQDQAKMTHAWKDIMEEDQSYYVRLNVDAYSLHDADSIAKMLDGDVVHKYTMETMVGDAVDIIEVIPGTDLSLVSALSVRSKVRVIYDGYVPQHMAAAWCSTPPDMDSIEPNEQKLEALEKAAESLASLFIDRGDIACILTGANLSPQGDTWLNEPALWVVCDFHDLKPVNTRVLPSLWEKYPVVIMSGKLSPCAPPC